MNAARRWPVIILALALALASTPSLASTTVAIYAIVDDIVFEPSDFEPERAWISGVFVVPQPMSSGLHQPPARGHLYFDLNTANPVGTRADWQALRAAAGTGHVVGFGQYWMLCSSSPTRTALGRPFPGNVDANCSFDTIVHTTDRTRAIPGRYPAPGEKGVVTVFDHDDDLCPRFGRPSVQIIADLREAHAPGSVRDEPPPCPQWIGLLASSDLDQAFRLQSRDGGWADATEALILRRFADVDGLQLADLSVQCRDTVCRIHVAFPSLEYEETTGNQLTHNALRELPGFATGGKIIHGRDEPTFDYYIQRRKPAPAN
jgi:hypothetical protein